MKYQIKSDKGYYSRSMSTGKAIFLDSSEMGYTFTKEEAEKMLERLEKETGKDLEIVEYKPYYENGGNIKKYYTTSFPMYFSEFLEIEVDERENYDLEDIEDWKSKYNLKNDDLVLWVTPKPYIAARYQMPSEDWDMAEQIYNDNPNNYGVEEVEENGVIIEESDDGDDGYLMIINKNKMAKGGEIYNFDVYLYNDDEDRTIKEKKRYKVKASSRNSAYDKAKNKYPRPYFVELYSVDTYADGGSVSDSIAMTILRQLGGMNRLIAMTGAYNFVDLGNGVAFKIKNQRANYIKIKLNSMDLYDLEVGRIRGTTYKVVATHKDVYFDQLKPLIEKATGMYLSLFAKGGKIKREENDVFDAYVPPTPEEKAAKEQKKQEQQMKMAKIAMMMAKDGAEISGFDVENLDLYEKMRYERLISHNMSKKEALNVLINDVDGDYSQLSPELRKYAKKNKYAQGGITDEMMEAKMILGDDKWNKMNEEEKLKVTQYLIRKGRIEAGREEYEYDSYPYAKGGRVRFQDKVDAISKRLEGTKVPKRLRKDYGATYDKKESEMAAKRIVGSMVKKYE